MKGSFLNKISKTSEKCPGLTFFQPKLSINKPNDVYEQEADSVSEQVMRMPVNRNENTFFEPVSINSIQRKCAACDEEDMIQRKENNNGKDAAEDDLKNYIGGLNTGGAALGKNIRSFFEPRFGYDFSNVRIHNDSDAAKSAQSINALAYTSGKNIVFNQNQYSPETDTGKRLLGHELTHVIQQGSEAPGNSVQKTESGDNKGGGWNSDIDSILINSANYYLKVQLGIKDDYAYSRGGCEVSKDNTKYCKVNTKKGFIVNIFWQPDKSEMTISSTSCIGGNNNVCRYSYAVAGNGQLVHTLIYCDALACI